MTGQVTIIDYGLGNLFNLQRAIRFCGGEGTISGDPDRVVAADRIILPGVGAFAAGMDNLKRNGMDAVIKEFHRTGRPILGVCLGMQLLLGRSEEGGDHEGLGLIDGAVTRLESWNGEGPRYKIPHMSWNQIAYSKFNPEADWNTTLLRGVEEGAYFYFVHSYAVSVDNSSDSLATTEYGGNVFTSVLERNNVTGCQFHPEMSDVPGITILRNFLER